MSSFSSSSSSPMVTVPICAHGLEADMLTSHTTKNPNRRFFCCCLRKWDDCKFFRWVDFSYPSSYCVNDCARRLQLQKDDYENQLQCRAMTERKLTDQLMKKTEDLRLKTEECLALKAKLEEATEWKKWFVALLKKIVFLLIIGAFLAKTLD